MLLLAQLNLAATSTAAPTTTIGAVSEIGGVFLLPSYTHIFLNSNLKSSLSANLCVVVLGHLGNEPINRRRWVLLLFFFFFFVVVLLLAADAKSVV